MRYLDFAKVRDVERKKATELFGTAEEPTELASKVRLRAVAGAVSTDAGMEPRGLD